MMTIDTLASTALTLLLATGMAHAWPAPGADGAATTTALAADAASSQDAAELVYGAAPGPYDIRVRDSFELHNTSRDKSLQLRVTYPDGGSGSPVIIWSHGARGSKDIYQPLIRHWASHGYVCIQPNHSDSRDFGMTDDKTRTFGDWASRPADIRLVLDSLGEIETGVEGLAGTMDPTMIGVGGHSFGAHTAQLVAGARTRDRQSGGYVSHADPRPHAFVLLSPQGAGRRESMLDSGSWSDLIRPTLSITGSNDPGRTGRGWRWRLDPFIHSPPEDKYLLFIKGAYHGFGGVVGSGYATTGPDNADHAGYVIAVTTAFWDAYLRGSKTAHAFLQTDTLARLTLKQAEIIVRGQNDDRIAALGGDPTDQNSRPSGTISPEQIVARFDRDGDGSLSESEMPPRLAPAFEAIDTNGDETVSSDELSVVLERRR